MANVYTNPETLQHKAFIESLPNFFDAQGEVIYKGRNVLKRFVNEGQSIIVKSYCTPLWFNRFVYRFFRKPKAVRSFEYANLLLSIGVGSPKPIGYYIETKGMLIGRTYFASLESECPNSYRDISKFDEEEQTDILKAIARTTAILHEHRILHKDYSAGNILFKREGNEVLTEIIDLNRIRFGKVDIVAGCSNFDRLPGTARMLQILCDEYCLRRGFNKEAAIKIFIETHGEDNKYIR